MASIKNTSLSNITIAKNTIFMYLRMLLIMIVSLYTSRVILQTLGESDFGTYNVVAGVVVLFSFISNAMATGTQRHLSYELGKPDGDIAKIFTACFRIHVWISVAVLILAETIGLWFVNTKMNFPDGRLEIVNWLYQFTIVSCLFGIVQVPFTAAIIARESMSFYAYLGIAEVLLKLAIVFLLTVIPLDQLLVYSALVMMVSIVVFVLYVLYSTIHLSGIKLVKISDKSLYKQLVSFSLWSVFGSIANVGYQQGINILINIFYGVGLNASVGIANQVNSAVSSFVSNFQQAINPQLTQSEASGDKDRQHLLIQTSSKFSFFIMALIAYPIIINLDYILTLWLGVVPIHTSTICSLIIISALIDSMSGALWVSIFATGKIKNYQIAISLVLLLNIPISYITGKLGYPPESMFIARSVIFLCALMTRLFFVTKYTGMTATSYVKNVIFPVCVVLIALIIPYWTIKNYCLEAVTLGRLILESFILVLYAGISILFFGLTSRERQFVYRIITRK